jgi:hypothetical protein
MTTQTTDRRTWIAVGLAAAAVTAATAWAVLTFAVDTGTHATERPVAVRLSASEKAYLSGISSMYYPRLAAAYSPRPSTPSVLKQLGPAERRYVRGILALTPEQLRAGFGTVRP